MTVKMYCNIVSNAEYQKYCNSCYNNFCNTFLECVFIVCIKPISAVVIVIFIFCAIQIYLLTYLLSYLFTYLLT